MLFLNIFQNKDDLSNKLNGFDQIDINHDLNQLKKVTNDLINGNNPIIQNESKLMKEEINNDVQKSISFQNDQLELAQENDFEILTLQDHEIKMIKESLIRHQGRRKDAADELGISERTLYRKIKEYKL